MTDIHDIESSAPAVQAARADDAPEQGASAEGGDERPRRGLRRGPRSLIARRRAAAKSKGADGEPQGGEGAVAPIGVEIGLEVAPLGAVLNRVPEHDLRRLGRRGRGRLRGGGCRRRDGRHEVDLAGGKVGDVRFVGKTYAMAFLRLLLTALEP